MVTARKFPELGAAVTEDIPEIAQIETTTRTLSLDWGDDEPAIDIAASAQPEKPSPVEHGDFLYDENGLPK